MESLDPAKNRVKKIESGADDIFSRDAEWNMSLPYTAGDSTACSV
jgi:hypothetical protein